MINLTLVAIHIDYPKSPFYIWDKTFSQGEKEQSVAERSAGDAKSSLPRRAISIVLSVRSVSVTGKASDNSAPKKFSTATPHSAQPALMHLCVAAAALDHLRMTDRRNRQQRAFHLFCNFIAIACSFCLTLACAPAPVSLCAFVQVR